MDVDNGAAGTLYRERGYEPLPAYDVPAWQRTLFSLPYIRYHRKSLVDEAGDVDVAAGE